MSDENIFDDALQLDPKEAEQKLSACVSIIRQCAASLPVPEIGSAKPEGKETEREMALDDPRPVVEVRRSAFAQYVDHKKRGYDPNSIHRCKEDGSPIIGTKNRLQCLGRWQKAENVNPVRVKFVEDVHAEAFKEPEKEPEPVAGEMVAPLRPAGSNSKQVVFLYKLIARIICGNGYIETGWPEREKELVQAVTDFEIASGKRIPLHWSIALGAAFVVDIFKGTESEKVKQRFSGVFSKGQPKRKEEKEPEKKAVEVKETELVPVNPFERMGE